MSEHPISEPDGIVNTSKSTAPVGRWEFALTAILLAAIVCATFTRSIFFREAYYWGDIGLYFLPLSQFLKSNLATGNLPLWNPYLFCGAPYAGNPQVSILYPLTILLPLLPAVSAIMISEALHIFAAGVFFWVFARHGSLRLNYLPSLLGACMYMLSGYFVAKAQFPNMLAALSYVPILLYATERIVFLPIFRNSVGFCVAFGLQLLCAHTQIAVFTLYLIVAYGLWVYYNSPQPRKSLVKVLSFGLIGGILAIGLSCGYWLPTAELIHSAARQALTMRAANRFYLPWYELGDFILPHAFGSPMRGDWRAHGNYWETDNYIGIVPFFLAIFGMYRAISTQDRRDMVWRTAIFWLGVFIVSAWLSLGVSGGLYAVAFFIVPGLDLFHDPGRLMLGANVALALYGGYGLQCALASQLPQRRPAWAVLAFCLCLVDMGRHAATIYPLKPVAQIQAMSAAAVPKMLASSLASPGSGRIMMPDSQRAWQNFTTYRTYEQNDPFYLQQWPDTLSPCLGMTYGIREVGGYDPEFRKDSQELVSIAQSLIVPQLHRHTKHLPPPPEFSPYLAMLGVQYLVAYRADSLDAAGLKACWRSPWRRHERVVTVYKNLDYVGRAELYSSWRSARTQNDALTDVWRKLDGAFQPDAFTSPIVEGVRAQLSSRPRPAEPVKIVSDNPDQVDLLAPAEIGPSMLVLADTLHPGWTATINGKPAAILRANVDQRAVLIAPSNTPTAVAFIYHPVDFLFGLYVSLVSLAIALSGLLATWASRHQPNGNAYPDGVQ